jgi:PIN domain nuclease of toxin-antitoxin system
MRYLLDTHIFISAINNESGFDKTLLDIIDTRNNNLYLSVASLWEISIKINISKLILKRDLDEMYHTIDKFGISILDISKSHLKTLLYLPHIHKDPFDRLIISQAIAEDLTIITDDQFIKNYPNLKLI